MDSFKGTSYIDILYEIIPELKESQPGCLQSEKLPHLKNIIVLGEHAPILECSWSDFG